MTECNFVILSTPLGSDILLSGLAVLLWGSEWVTDRVLWSSPLVFSCFSAHQTSHKHNTFLTSKGDLRTPLEYSFCVSRSLLSCRSKGQAGRQEAAGADHHRRPALLSKLCKTSRWDSRSTMCPRPMFTSAVEALPFPSPSQYFGAEKESVIWGLAVYCVCGHDSCEAARTVW